MAETGGGGRSIGGVIVLVVIGGGLAAVWGSLATMIDTLKAPGRLPPSEDAPALRDVLPEGEPDDDEGDGPGLQEALAGVADATAQVADQLEEPPPLPTLPPRSASPTALAVQEAIAAGDCGAAADAVVEAAESSPGEVVLIEDVWGCLQNDRDALGGLDLSDPGALSAASGPLDGLESGMAAFTGLEAAGLGGFVEDMLGAANIAAGMADDLGLEASLAEIAAAEPPTSMDGMASWADRAYTLAGAMSGPVGETVADHAPAEHAELQGRLEALMGDQDLPDDIKDAYLEGMTLGLEGDPRRDAAPDPEGEATASTEGADAGAEPVSTEAAEGGVTSEGGGTSDEAPQGDPTATDGEAPPADGERSELFQIYTPVDGNRTVRDMNTSGADAD